MRKKVYGTLPLKDVKQFCFFFFEKLPVNVPISICVNQKKSLFLWTRTYVLTCLLWTYFEDNEYWFCKYEVRMFFYVTIYMFVFGYLEPAPTRVSISATFYRWLLCTKVLREAFLCLHFRFELFWGKNIISTTALIKC